MATDKQQFVEATRKWEILTQERQFSRAPELGLTAVIYAQYDCVQTEDEEEYKQIDSVVFAEEAQRIAEMVNQSGGDAFTIKGLTHESFEHGVIANQDVANVVVISHGNLSAVYTDDGHIINWGEVADMTTHLKTGYFEQRFCGNQRRSLSVPLGLFAVTRAQNVFAPVGQWFAPEIVPEHEGRMRPVTAGIRLGYKQIRELFLSK